MIDRKKVARIVSGYLHGTSPDEAICEICFEIADEIIEVIQPGEPVAVVATKSGSIDWFGTKPSVGSHLYLAPPERDRDHLAMEELRRCARGEQEGPVKLTFEVDNCWHAKSKGGWREHKAKDPADAILGKSDPLDK